VSNDDVFSLVKLPKHRVLQNAVIGDVNENQGITNFMGGLREANIGLERGSIVRSKIISHFLKGKISLNPMKTILTIPRELEYLDGLVKVAKKKVMGKPSCYHFTLSTIFKKDSNQQDKEQNFVSTSGDE
jgi:hypothetical protein